MSDADFAQVRDAAAERLLAPGPWEEAGYAAGNSSRVTPRPQDFPEALQPGPDDPVGGPLTAARVAYSSGWQRRFHEDVASETAAVSPVALYVDESGRLIRATSPSARVGKVRGDDGKPTTTKVTGALRPATMNEVADAGKNSGVCQVCGRALKDERSIARGIGATCVSKF